MNVVDIVIIIVASSAIAVGMRIGLLRQLGLSAGIFLGCFVAALVQTILGPYVVKAVGDDEHIVFWLMLVAAILIVGLFTDMGIAFGRWLWGRWKILQDRRGQWITKWGGSFVAGVVALLALWLLSVLFLRSPIQAISNNVGHSAIFNSLSKLLPAAPLLFSRASNLLNPHAEPVVFFAREPKIGAQLPGVLLDETAHATIITRAASTVEVVGRGCGGVVHGSGFVVADNLVMTTAHGLAGVTQIEMIDGKGAHNSTPVYFDPLLDFAVLRTSGLVGSPIPVETSDEAQVGAGATLTRITGGSAVHAVTMTGRQSATGYDIYDQNVVTRDIYAFRGSIQKGDSGGPLVNTHGRVVGLVLSKSKKHPNVGYALAINEAILGLVGALASAQPVSTGQCGTH